MKRRLILPLMLDCLMWGSAGDSKNKNTGVPDLISGQLPENQFECKIGTGIGEWQWLRLDHPEEHEDWQL